jgi:Uma2 family endonuclease
MTAGLHDNAIVWGAELHLESAAEQIMSMPVVRPRRWTTEEVRRLIDERRGMSPRYELVVGELLVTPAPTHRHQRLVLRLALRLQPYLTRHGIGEVFLGPAELKLASGEIYEPDLFVVPASDGRNPAMGNSLIRPLLICETLSPDSSRHDRITKRRSFQRNAVPEYWIMDGDAQAFEIWHPTDDRPALVDDRLVWSPMNGIEAFELDIAAFFASAEDDAPLP